MDIMFWIEIITNLKDCTNESRDLNIIEKLLIFVYRVFLQQENSSVQIVSHV